MLRTLLFNAVLALVLSTGAAFAVDETVDYAVEGTTGISEQAVDAAYTPCVGGSCSTGKCNVCCEAQGVNPVYNQPTKNDWSNWYGYGH